MDNDNPTDQFDELFEPFELPDAPPEEELSRSTRTAAAEGVTAASSSTTTVACPSCGTGNPSYNRHCEQCGARLTQDPLPIAPAPLSRTSPGGRALGVLAAVVLVVALVALVFNVFREGGEEVASPEETSSTTTVVQPAAPIEIFASSVVASTELLGWEADNLIDGNAETYWNDEGLRGKDAWLRFRFAQPVQLTEIEVVNLADEERFKRNYKIQGYQIEVDDLDVEITGRLQNTNEPQRIKIASLETTELIIRITSTFTAEPAADKPPFNELAVQGVRFFGIER